MILIDYKDRRPLYEQIVEKLSDLMVRGILEQDSQLPSVRSLATELSMNPNTIQRAYAELERQGYIYSVKGRGSFVADNRQIRERKRQEIWDQLELLIGMQKEPASRCWSSRSRSSRAMEVRKEETGMIKAENLTKRFYDTVAVDHIHAEIHNGSVFGLIGTNVPRYILKV